jgi:hypothetical protein
MGSRTDNELVSAVIKLSQLAVEWPEATMVILRNVPRHALCRIEMHNPHERSRSSLRMCANYSQ